jgi:M6 family metalloprotease-like protein
MELLVTADGVHLDYPPDGVWRARARQVAALRARLRSQGDIRTLNAPIVSRAYQPPGGAVAGTLRYPTILYGFLDTSLGSLPDSVKYDSVFYTAQPLAGRPYTVHTFYDEMSHGLLNLTGQTYNWRLDTFARTYYADACGAGNVLDCPVGRSRVYQLFIRALSALDDGKLDFGQFDNDGPDGIPNSGDDDGVVDVAQFVGPIVGGECGGRGVWAHKFALSNLTGAGPYVTKSPRFGGGFIKVDAYHAVSGVGGVQCGDTTQIMGIGTASHELGHGLGLPDLYDVSGNTQGIGEWGIMGSGNYTTLLSPAHHDAWSKQQLGWVVIRILSAAGNYSLGPVVTGDTVFEIRPRGANPRGEYFLLENKQALGSDAPNISGSGLVGNKPGKGGGLLVWHIDSAKVAVTGLTQGNSVNAGSPHGVALVEADGLGDLDRLLSDPKSNRGDAGDPYPGTSGNPVLSKHSNPAALDNSYVAFVGFALSKIHQDVPNGAMSFQLGFASIIRPGDTLGYVRVSGTTYHRLYDVLSLDSAVTVDAPDTTDGGARFTFRSWSDGGLRIHTVTAAAIRDSLVATLDAQYRLLVSTTGAGTVTSTPSVDITSGAFYPAGSVFKLVASSAPENVFDGWSGDTASVRDTLVLTMRRPYQQLVAHFVPPLAAAVQPPPPAIMGAAYQYDIATTGGTGQYTWLVQSGQLPPGLSFFTNGRVSGTPEATGAFAVSLRVVSGNQVLNFALTFTVNAPTVSLEAAVNQLLKVGTPLTADQLRYFDLLGNRDGRYDLGDFLAWVKKTGVHPSAAIMARALAAVKDGKP